MDLIDVLKKKQISNCQNCRREITQADISWNDRSEVSGTPYSVIEIQCLECGYEVASIRSWYSPIEDLEDLSLAIDEGVVAS